MHPIYALLVGIDDYPGCPLKGCVNDALAWREYLQEGPGRHRPLNLEILLDREATRGRIIEGFRHHLTQAREGDTALFCFSGHGSEESTPLPYCAEEPGGVGETLVAWDSRREGGFDLADKELAALIAEVGRGGAHVVVALDSCHSGTGTREARVEGAIRRVKRSPRRRPAGSYWFEEEGADLPADLTGAGGWWILPRGRHVALAACEDYQKAKECTAPDGTKRGLFSYFLLEGLSRLGPGVSYRKLHRYVQVRVRNLFSEQNPQAEGELEQAALEGAATSQPSRFHVQVQKDGTVWLDGGAVHGVAAGAEVAVLESEGPHAPGAPEGERVLARASVVEVAPGRSRLELDAAALPRGLPVYPARITRLPTSRLRIHPSHTNADRLLGTALERSPLLATAARPEEADVLVSVERDRGHLRRPEIPWDLVEPLELPGTDRRQPFWTGVLESVARWQTLAALSNPVSPLSSRVAMTVWEWSLPQDTGGEPELRPLPNQGDVELPYREDRAGEAQARRITVQLTNAHPEPIYYHLLALDEDFGVSLLPGGTGRLPGESEVWVEQGRGIPARVPDRLHARGITRRQDLLLLLLSTAALDATLLTQDGLASQRKGAARSAARRSSRAETHLESLLTPARHRSGGAGRLASEGWAATSLQLVSLRPTRWVSLAGEERTVEPVPGLRIHVPGGLRGRLRLSGSPPEKSAQDPLRNLPEELVARLRPASLTPGLGSDPGLCTLELRLEEPAEVPGDAPFFLETETRPGPGEIFVAVVWDGRQSHLVAPEKGDPGEGICRLAPVPGPAREHDQVWLWIHALSGF